MVHKGINMYNNLLKIHQRPDVFSIYTADLLWTQAHLAKQMLLTHLDQKTPLASRPIKAINQMVNWIDNNFQLNGKTICDLGCGPGLYAERYAQLGAHVSGLDFSSNSIEYAKASALEKDISINYITDNYLTAVLPNNQDLITLIYCDLCPLSPSQRHILFKKISQSLNKDGIFIFDVASIKAFDLAKENCSFGHNYMNGFWSKNDYFTFHNSYRYEDEMVLLDHFKIVEANGTWDIYNWMQYFTPESIEEELNLNGFDMLEIIDGFGIDPTDKTTFGVIAKSNLTGG